MNPSGTKRAIEESFPIVEINCLAVPERNAFKPIYQMHKWFARRASCVFRAILLGAMKPAGADIMAEFYKDHTEDPETKGVRILDPFMGGGTTVVEALRMGCHVTGIDLNPVAWFIVKAEVESVDLKDLNAAFKRLEERSTASGKPVKEELLSHYKTECPCCGSGQEEADIIYTFWVKAAVCTNPTCRQEVPLFGNYIIAAKTPTVRYVPDYECTSCNKSFDLEVDRVSLMAETSLMINHPRDAAGDRRSNKHWAAFDPVGHQVTCPWCSHRHPLQQIGKLKKEKKKIQLNVLLCPHCRAVWQYRGALPDEVNCPVCAKGYEPKKGNLPEKGNFLCLACGTKDRIINAIRSMSEDQLLPTAPYTIEGYCSKCAGDVAEDLFGNSAAAQKKPTHLCNLRDNNGKFFKKMTPADIKRYQEAERRWEKEKDDLPYPKSEIPVGEKTKSGLIAHHYRYWHHMFNPRQLLCLATLLKAIDGETNQTLKEMLLCAFSDCVGRNNLFCRYFNDRNTIQEIFSRHDYQPKNTIAEGNIFGDKSIRGTYPQMFGRLLEGKGFNDNAFDWYRVVPLGKPTKSYVDKNIDGKQAYLRCGDSSNVISLNSEKLEHVITDPPYAGNVNYSELADFFYVWLRLILAKTYTHFAPEMTPKAAEIIENPSRGKTAADYEEGLTAVWRRCGEALTDDGLLVFTFHHAEIRTWETLLESLCNAGFLIEAVYPIHGEKESSLHLMETEAISYDLIHVCRKRNGEATGKQRSWAGVRQEIRNQAREEIRVIEAGRYGKEKLAAADINIILIGKCLELYSRHYGRIIDYQGDEVGLRAALGAIRMMVEQIVTTQRPLPSELENIDPISYVYLTCLCDRKEIKSDEVHKTTRGLMEPDALIKAGVMRKGRAKRGRTYEVKTPDERYSDLQKLFAAKTKSISQLSLFPEMEEAKFDRVALVDALHFLMGLADAQENLIPWLKECQPIIPQIRVAMEYLREKNPTFQVPVERILSLIEV
jgi:adenine-specific DNA methylase